MLLFSLSQKMNDKILNCPFCRCASFLGLGPNQPGMGVKTFIHLLINHFPSMTRSVSHILLPWRLASFPHLSVQT